MAQLVFSIISHGHHQDVTALLKQISALHISCRVILTINRADLEPEHWAQDLLLNHPTIHVVKNQKAQAFSVNHNLAFQQACRIWGFGQASQASQASQDIFCVINPDIQLNDDPSAALQQCLRHASIGMAFPVQMDAQGRMQDSVRILATPWQIFKRQVLRQKTVFSGVPASSEQNFDWVNGAFMAFRASVYKTLGGFDERFFMYCEDVDICLRLQLAGYTMTQLHLSVTHDSRRATLKSAQHFYWHVRSLLRLWCSPVYWRYMHQKSKKLL